MLITDMPLDLRYKKTRAIRRRLTFKEKNLITEKAHKKLIHFPARSEFDDPLLDIAPCCVFS